MVETTRVTGRRELHFASYQDILDDVHSMAAVPKRVLGNWSLGQICAHLAKALDYGVEGAPFRVPFWMRMVGPWVKNRVLSRPMSPGFKLPKTASDYIPGNTDDQVGIAELERAIARFQATPVIKPHVVLGPLTRSEWDQLNFRHAEMHLGFIVPQQMEALP